MSPLHSSVYWTLPFPTGRSRGVSSFNKRCPKQTPGAVLITDLLMFLPSWQNNEELTNKRKLIKGWSHIREAVFIFYLINDDKQLTVYQNFHRFLLISYSFQHQTWHKTNHSSILKKWASLWCPKHVGISELVTIQTASLISISTIETIKSCASGRSRSRDVLQSSSRYLRTFFLKVAAFSLIVPAQTSLCRGRPDAELWSGSAAGCRPSTAGLGTGHTGIQGGLVQSQEKQWWRLYYPPVWSDSFWNLWITALRRIIPLIVLTVWSKLSEISWTNRSQSMSFLLQCYDKVARTQLRQTALLTHRYQHK